MFRGQRRRCMSRTNGDAVGGLATTEPERPVPLPLQSDGRTRVLDGQLALPTEPPAALPTTNAVFTEELLLRDRTLAPARGWRRVLFRVTAGRVAPRPSAAELRERELVARLKTP